MMDILARTAANRRMPADFFDGLDEEQLDTRSLCAARTVRDCVGVDHLRERLSSLR